MSRATHLLPASSQTSIAATADCLREGGVAVLPTDTLYGLSASVLQPQAVERLFEVKGRSADAPVPVLIGSASDLPLIVENTPRLAWKLIDRYWPGPLTLVLPARASVSPLVTAGGSTVAVRVPAARSCLRVIELLGQPVVGTSANLSGQPPALTAGAALEVFDGLVDMVLQDDAAIQTGRASTVVDLTGERPVIHRVGVVGADAIRDAVGVRVNVAEQLTSRATRG